MKHVVGFLLLFSSLLFAQRPAPPAEVVRVIDDEISREMKLSGMVRSLKTGDVAAQVSGLIMKILVQEGDSVTQGQVLLETDVQAISYQIDALKQQLKAAEARYHQAQLRLKRAIELREKQVYSQQTFEDNQFEVEAQSAQVAQLNAKLQELSYYFEQATLKAPFDGVIVSKQVEVGSWLSAGKVAFYLVADKDLVVALEVPDRFYNFIDGDDQGKISFSTIPGLILDGQVHAKIPLADTSRNLKIQVRFDPGTHQIPIGILAEVLFAAGETHQATLVPKDAITLRGLSSHVLVVNDENVIELVPVTLGLGKGAWTEVKGNLKAGQRVVTLGNERLGPGMTVVPIEKEYVKP